MEWSSIDYFEGHVFKKLDFSNLNDVNEEIIFKNEIGRIRDIQIHPSTVRYIC